MEAFKVLEQFLCNTKIQCEINLLSLDMARPESVVRAAISIAEINTLGTILKLPQTVAELKKQFDEVEFRNLKLKEDSADPLNLEEL
jgi:hypothetical protein